MSGLATERVLLGPAIVSFPSLFQPSSTTGKYEIDVIYEKGSETHKKIKKLEKQAIDNKWGTKVPKKLLLLVYDGDEKLNDEGEVLDGYEGKLYSKLRTSRPPQVTDVRNDIIEDPMEIKGGDTCVALAHAFPYDNTEWKKKGVLLTLGGVRKIKDGEALGGGATGNAAEAMSSYEADTGNEEF